MAQLKWKELTPEQKARVIRHDEEMGKDDPWNTAQAYTETKAAAWLRGQDYVEAFTDFVDWWDTMEEEDQQQILTLDGASAYEDALLALYAKVIREEAKDVPESQS